MSKTSQDVLDDTPIEFPSSKYSLRGADGKKFLKPS